MKAASQGMKAALITGGCNRVGLQAGVHLARKFPEGSVIYLTTKHEAKVAELQESLLTDYEPQVREKLKFAHLDLQDSGMQSLIKLKDQIKKENVVIDVIGEVRSGLRLRSLTLITK